MKKFKKILSCIMTVIMCVFLFSGVDFKEASAEILEFKFPTSKGTLYYKISNNEVEIQAYIGKDTKLEIPSKINGKSVTTIRYGAFDNCGSLTSIVIPDSVTSIGNNAFYNCDSLTSIVIPDSVTSIGDNVFCGCSSLTSIAIPDSVTSIGDSAFSFCSSLTSITIPNSVTSIGDSAFSLCSSLTSITIPNSVTSIGDSAFDHCYSLISIIIPDSVTSIGDFAFNNCDSLTSITIPNSVSSIENCTFMNCDSLTSIEIPNSVTSIGNGAFRNCDSLTSIEIPNSVTSIGNYAFADCDGLTSIEIPDSVSSIGIGTFSDCDSLTNINVNNKNYIDKDGILFSKDEKTLIQYPAGKKERSYSIPDSVTSIGSDAFAFCDILASIEIPNSVTSIGDYAFDHCYSLISIIIPDSVTNIGDYAFSFSGLEYIAIPKSVISIGDSAFQSFSNDLTICGYKNSYAETYAKEHLFYFEEIIPMSISISSFIADKASSQTNEKVLVTLTTQADGVGLLKYKYYGYLNGNYIEIEDWTTSNSVTTTLNAVGIYDLWVEVKDLTGTTIKKNLSFCNYDKYGDFGYSYNSIGNEVVITDYLGSAEELNVPSEINDKKVTNIKDHTFYGCENLRSITIPDSITSIGYYVFGRCISLGSITIPNSVTKIESFAFDQCFSLRSITIPDSVTSIGEYAFQSCSNLTSIIIPNSVTNINYYAFHGCNKLTIYGYKNSCAETYAKNKGIPFEEIKPITISSFIADKVSSQAIGTEVTLTAQANGTGSLQYKYYRYLNGNYATIKDWSKSNSVTITPSTAGTYDLWVAVKDETGKIVKKNISFTFTKPLGISSMTTDKQSPQYTGTSIKLTTQASGGTGTLQYKYYSYLNGKYSEIKNWSTTNNVTITPSAAGTYDLWVAVKDSEGTIIKKNIKFIFDKALGINSFTTDKVSPQYVGTSVKLTVQAVGGKGTKQYKYYRYLNGSYKDIKDWSTTNNVTINPSTAGTYDLWVAVKDETGKIVKKNMNFTFNKPLGISSITTDKKSPQYTGTSVKLTTQAIGGIGTLQYKYYSYLNGSYATIKDWSTTNNVTITPNTAGTYDLWVAVKDSEGTIIKKNIKFTFDKSLGINSFTTDKVSPQYTGTSVKLTIQADGGKGTKQYKYYRYLNGSYATIKDWSTTNNVTINPSTAGTYDLWVAVKDETGKIVKKNMNFTFTKPLGISSVTTDKKSPQYTGTSVKLTTQASGGIGTLQYKYYRYLNGSYATIKDWSTTNNVTITPNTAGTYDLWVAVKDSKGTIVKKNIKFTFDKALGINSFTTDKVSPQYVGTSVKLTVQAVGGKGTKQYKYYRYLNGSYATIKDWSTINNVTITPSTAGTYDLWVAIKDETGKVVKKNINFSFNKTLEVSSLTTDKVSPQYVESSINIIAKASGGIGTLQYRFRVGNPDGTYSIIKDYSTSNTAVWNANYIGNKILYVDVKDSRGKIVTKSVNYTIKAKPLEINSFTTDKASPQYKGSSLKMTANASGGEGTLQYRFRAGNPDGSYSVVKDYSTTNTVVWTANYSGSKILYVDVKDSKGNVVTKSINYSIKEKPVINSFTTDKTSPQNLGTTIKLTANVSGGANLQYKFSVQGEDGNTITLREYSSSNTYSWTPSKDGNQTLYVDVKDSLGVTLRKSISYNVIFVCKVNTEDFRKAVGDEMYRLVNEHRNNNGVASFTVDSVMEECAYDKSKHMSDNKYFSHDYNGEYWWDMYPEKYANWSNLGENIVLTHTDPNKVYTREECKEIAEELFTLWKNSPGHNANMLNASFKQIGFGLYVNSSGSLFGTQEFITRFK